MATDKPQIGLVIRHVYLWRDEAKQGHEEGRKARPCVIIHARQNEDDKTEVYIAPITHTEPKTLKYAKEIPLVTKKRLKLDDEKSWIITSEVNRFTWIGFDVRKTPSGEFAYGHLPPKLTKAVITQIQHHAREKQMAVVDRDENPKKKA